MIRFAENGCPYLTGRRWAKYFPCRELVAAEIRIVSRHDFFLNIRILYEDKDSSGWRLDHTERVESRVKKYGFTGQDEQRELTHLILSHTATESKFRAKALAKRLLQGCTWEIDFNTPEQFEKFKSFAERLGIGYRLLWHHHWTYEKKMALYPHWNYPPRREYSPMATPPLGYPDAQP
jgi:hypothetical protein